MHVVCVQCTLHLFVMLVRIRIISFARYIPVIFHYLRVWGDFFLHFQHFHSQPVFPPSIIKQLTRWNYLHHWAILHFARCLFFFGLCKATHVYDCVGRAKKNNRRTKPQQPSANRNELRWCDRAQNMYRIYDTIKRLLLLNKCFSLYLFCTALALLRLNTRSARVEQKFIYRYPYVCCYQWTNDFFG